MHSCAGVNMHFCAFCVNCSCKFCLSACVLSCIKRNNVAFIKPSKLQKKRVKQIAFWRSVFDNRLSTTCLYNGFFVAFNTFAKLYFR